jgi:hypothetical protein
VAVGTILGKPYTPIEIGCELYAQPLEFTVKKKSDVSVIAAVVTAVVPGAITADTWFDVQLYVNEGSFGVAVSVIFPPLPHKLGTEELKVIGVTVTVTWVLGPSQVPLPSDT